VISRGDISIEREGAVAILMLDRPDKHNAITQYMREGKL
jgi:enoyl-CoA hydratase/carnithine racemase